MKWLKDRFKYAFEGLYYAFTKDASIRLQGIFGLVVLLISFIIRINTFEWILILSAIAFVLVAEIFNSCIEKCVDYISLEYTSQAKHIKDMAAGAVFIVSVLAACIGFYVFLPKLF